MRRTLATVVLALAVGAAACTEGDDDAADTTAAAATEAPAVTEAPAETTAATTAAEVPADTTAAPAPDTTAVPEAQPATGEPFKIGVVNTEGAPGLDFPEFRLAFEAAQAYANDNGGIAGRPIELVSCIAKGTPETSQSCGQELAAAEVELVLAGLDVFLDHATFQAAGIPVVGMVPVLPPDYQAPEAVFFTAGNLAVMTAMAKVATGPDYFGGTSVAVVGADAPAVNSALGSLQPALEKAGATVTIVKGGLEETDAGYQGLLREATKDSPDVLISLYSDAGCVGIMRGYQSLGLTTPAITTNVCANKNVLDVVGDAAEGWVFSGAGPRQPGAESDVLLGALAAVQGVPIEDVNQFGFASVGFIQFMSMVDFANMAAEATGADGLTGQAIVDLIRTGEGLTLWGGGQGVACGTNPAYPSVCGYGLPFAQYTDGEVVVYGEPFISGEDLLS